MWQWCVGALVVLVPLEPPWECRNYQTSGLPSLGSGLQHQLLQRKVQETPWAASKLGKFMI